jgi:metal-sulfur cluster biosynthetic enzyme
MALTKENAVEVFKKILDPELNMDIYTLGLIYKIDVKDNDHIDIDLTFTSPMCPFGPVILEQVTEGLKNVGFKDPQVNVVFKPVWEPSEDVKIMLGVA